MNPTTREILNKGPRKHLWLVLSAASKRDYVTALTRQDAIEHTPGGTTALEVCKRCREPLMSDETFLCADCLQKARSELLEDLLR